MAPLLTVTDYDGIGLQSPARIQRVGNRQRIATKTSRDWTISAAFCI
jgi:hypothetical protein